jgi:gamma-glutamylcyclotransferase (GGCT)/AIG2-like uncharacterized protein YtfP
MMKDKSKSTINSGFIVFAYGSNMNRQQMAFRCPDARPLGVARLEGYRLTFAGFNARWGGGVATILPARRSTVLGRVWWISKTDLERLDGYEGYPFVYDRAPVVVKAGAREFWCHTYVKNAAEVQTTPSEDYLRTIIDGYQDARVRVPAPLKKLYMQVSYGA